MEKRVKVSVRIFLVASMVSVCTAHSALAQVPEIQKQLLDSLMQTAHNADSLWKADSLYRFKEAHTNQLATMRQLDLNGDGKTETLRLDGKVKPKTDDIELTFTIRSGSKMLWKESWKAKGYFDPQDALADTLKLLMLRHIVSKFFSNENFSIGDSASLEGFTDTRPFDVKPNSDEMREIENTKSVIFAVYRSRDFYYGLAWSRSRNHFTRVWRN